MAKAERARYVINIASKFDAAHWAPTWIEEAASRAEWHLKVDPHRDGAAYLRLAVDFAAKVHQAIAGGNAEAAAAYATGVMQALWQAELAEASIIVSPKVNLGNKFTAGRKRSSISPVRRFVRRYMQKHPAAKATEVWRELAAKPPRGVELYETSNTVARYIRTAGKPDTSYRQFQNIVSKERPKRA